MSTLATYDPFAIGLNEPVRDTGRNRGLGTTGNVPWTMDIDCIDTDSEYIVVCDLPGIEKEGVNISIEGNVLSMGVTKPTPTNIPPNVTCVINEIARGSDVRNVRLPMRGEAAQCVFKDGILVVRVPKLEGQPASKTLDINNV